MDRTALRHGALFAACILLPLAAGAIGSFSTVSSVSTWYAALRKPAFTPPDWLFGPVWTALYIMMGISLYLVVKNGIAAAPVRQGVMLFAAQLAANTLWSVVFFGMRSPFWALITIAALAALVAATIAAFLRVSRSAAMLLVPYLCWVFYASVLNAMIWMMN
jgi:tryptophan-rich sensory protein